MNTNETVNVGVAEVSSETVNNNENVSKKVAKQTFELQFPEGEFTIKNLVSQTGKKQPVIFMKVRDAIKRGEVREVRREQLSKQGRPSVIYAKV